MKWIQGLFKKVWSFAKDKRTYYFLLFLLVAILFSYYYMHLRNIMNRLHPTATLRALMKGTADTPFQYRLLVPYTVKWLEDILPFQILPETLFSIFEFLAIFFLIIVFRHYLSFFIKDKRAYTILSFSIVLILPWNYILPRMIDIPFKEGNFYVPIFMSTDTYSILFFTLGLILLYKRQWVRYYLLFSIATFNRETTCFLTFVYLFTAIGKDSYKTIAAHCLSQLIIWLSIKYYLYTLFAGNYGSGIIDSEHWRVTIDFFKEPHCYALLLSCMGGIWVPTVIYHRLIPDHFLSRSLLVGIPFFIGMALVGNLYELRIFGELIPIFLTGFLVIIKEMLQQKDTEPSTA